MNDRMSFRGFLDACVRHWKLFTSVVVVAAVLAMVFSGPSFIKPRYRSWAIVYPVNLNSYSIETRADQLLQLLESNSIRDSLITRFGLVEHYKADTTRAGGRQILYNIYRERVEISKTRYESVQIEVTDEKPEVARDMVQAVLDQVNLLARRLQREKSAELLLVTGRIMHDARNRMDSAEARLKVLRESQGLLVYESQTEELTKGYVRMLTSGATQAQKDEVRTMLRSLQEAGGEFRGLTDLSDMYRQSYNQAQLDNEKAQIDMTKVLTYTNVVVYPEVPDKKVYPVRWLIVLLSMAAAGLLCLVLVMLREQGRKPANARN